MLSLSDPLWPKLYHAYGYEDLPGLLGQFRSKPDREALTEFLFGSLIHQETCYPATYACAPHLLEIATTTAAVDVRKTVIAFLAWLIVCAFDEDSLSGPLAGIPPDHEAWLDKICVYNGSQARRPTRRDFDALQSLSIDFRAIIPKIGALCEQAFLDENGNAHAALQWLAGVVAAGGHPRLARIFEFGERAGQPVLIAERSTSLWTIVALSTSIGGTLKRTPWMLDQLRKRRSCWIMKTDRQIGMIRL